MRILQTELPSKTIVPFQVETVYGGIQLVPNWHFPPPPPGWPVLPSWFLIISNFIWLMLSTNMAELDTVSPVVWPKWCYTSKLAYRTLLLPFSYHSCIFHHYCYHWTTIWQFRLISLCHGHQLRPSHLGHSFTWSANSWPPWLATVTNSSTCQHPLAISLIQSIEWIQCKSSTWSDLIWSEPSNYFGFFIFDSWILNFRVLSFLVVRLAIVIYLQYSLLSVAKKPWRNHVGYWAVLSMLSFHWFIFSFLLFSSILLFFFFPGTTTTTQGLLR